MALLSQIASSNPSGSGSSIASTFSGPAANGDLVIALFCWDTGSGTHWLGSVSDTTGQVWTVLDPPTTPSLGGVAGGIAYCIVAGGGWSTSTTVTGVLNTSTPGGRCALGFLGPAADMAASPIDSAAQVITPQSTSTPSTTSGTLATPDELMVAFNLVKVDSATTAVMSWDAGWTVDGSVTGSGVHGVGIFVAEQSVTSTSPVTASGTTNGATTNQSILGVFPIKLASVTPVTGSAAISSASSMTGAGVAHVIGSAGASSASSMTAAGTPKVIGSAGASSSSSMTAAGTTRQTGSAAASSASSMTAAGTPKVIGSAGASSSSSVTAAGVTKVIGSAALGSSSDMTAAGTGTSPAASRRVHVEPGSVRLADAGGVRVGV